MNHLAIVVRDDAYDRILTPLTFAYTQAQAGVEVDILFVLWAVRPLTAEGAAALKSTRPRRRGRLAARRLAEDGEPTEIADWLAMLRETGGSGSMAAATPPPRSASPRRLCSGAEGIVDPGWFLRRRRSPQTTASTSDRPPRRGVRSDMPARGRRGPGRKRVRVGRRTRMPRARPESERTKTMKPIPFLFAAFTAAFPVAAIADGACAAFDVAKTSAAPSTTSPRASRTTCRPTATPSSPRARLPCRHARGGVEGTLQDGSLAFPAR